MSRRSTLLCLTVSAAGLIVAGCSFSGHHDASSRVSSAPTTAAGGRLAAPKTTETQDGAYFRDLATVDPSLSKYVASEQGVALRALLTDGSAFCAFLNRGGGIDNAMLSVVIGANSVEPQTHLPRGISTFNAIDSTALIALCPDEQHLVPAAALRHVKQLERALAKSPQSAVPGPA